jgi:hypothetical protein
MINNDILLFKQALIESMIHNFENDGCITPVLFFYMKDNPIIMQISEESLSTKEGKEKIVNSIKYFCSENPVLATGIIIEADCAKILANSETTELINNGNIKVSELKEKQDIIMLIFSTPEKEEVIAYYVNYGDKKVLDSLSLNNNLSTSGMFSKLFDWNLN